MYSEENKASNLGKFLSNFDYVFVDTCSLMEDGFPPFMDLLVASREYWKSGLHVIVPEECVKELKKHKKNKDKDDARIGAIRALKILRHDQWHGKTIEIEKGITDGNFGDQAIMQKAVGLRIKYKILVITQDKTLTNDLLKLNNLDSQRGHYLEVYKIMANGELTKNLGESGYSRPIEKKENQHHSFSLKTIFDRNRTSKERKKENDLSKNIKEADKKLASNLNNKNYPETKKLSDINSQLNLLSHLSTQEETRLSLFYSTERLLTEKEKIIQKNGQETERIEKETKSSSPNQEENKEDESELILSNEDLRTLIRDILSHFGVLIRDDSVPYLPLAHGPADVTESTLSSALRRLLPLNEGEKKEISFGEIVLKIEKVKNSFVAIAKMEKSSQKPTKKEDKKNPGISKTKAVAKTKKVSKTPKKQAKDKNRKKMDTKTKTETTSIKKPKAETKAEIVSGPVVSSGDAVALPSGIHLIVGEPSRRTRSSSSRAVTVAPKSKKKKQSATKKVTKERVNASTKKSKEKSKIDPKLFETTKAAELRLNANLNNPNYPVANKVRDIDAQLERIKKLSAEEKKKLKLNHADLTKKKNALSQK